MKKYFINQEKLSNKFWNIETRGKEQIVCFGKIGTTGREATKEFATEEECETDSKKLIAEKLKKGYTEVINPNVIPEKTSLTEDVAGEIFFWNAIDKSNKHKKAHWSDYDIDEHLENLTEILAKSNKQKIILFEKVLQEKLNELYTAEIAELAIILENEFTEEKGIITFDNYLSDDGFIYFRCWLLLKGEAFFKDITKDINSFISGKYSFNIGDCWAEGLLYVTDQAYAVKHDNKDSSDIRDIVEEQYPDVIHYDSMHRMMKSVPAGGAELQKKYPELVKEMYELRKS